MAATSTSSWVLCVLNSPLLTLGVALTVGVLATLVARRVGVPTIVALLVSGMICGVSGVVKPETLGEGGLDALVRGAVFIILFEGSLSLQPSAWRAHGGPIASLVTVGASVTWLGSTLAAHYVLGLNWWVATITGAVLIVTGPTVVIPLLRAVRPNARLREILRWEGILIDPIGAIAAVVAFEFVVSALDVGSGESLTMLSAVVVYGWHTLAGILCGVTGGLVINFGLRLPYLVPRDLATPFAFAAMLAAALAAEMWQPEAGIFAAPVAGVCVAMLNPPRLSEIERFNGELTTMLLAVLFVILAADVDPESVWNLGASGLLFLVALQGVRLCSVAVSTIGSALSWRERLFLGWLAPRGIVAASMASVFGAVLASETALVGADQIVPVTFLVITGTVVVQGLGARFVGRLLGVLAPEARNIVIAGATNFSINLALALQEAGVEVAIVDKNEEKVAMAEGAGILAYAGDVLAPASYHDLDLESTGAYLAATSSDKVNGLAALLASEIIGEDAVLQLPTGIGAFGLAATESMAIRRPLAFGELFTLASLNRILREGARMRCVTTEQALRASELRYQIESDLRPLLAIDRAGHVAFVRERDALLPPGIVIGIEQLPAWALTADRLFQSSDERPGLSPEAEPTS